MSSCIKGKGIRFIRHYGGLVAGDSERIDIHTCCDVITVTKPNDVSLIHKLINEAKRINVDINSYLEYMLVEEYGW